MKLNSSFAKTNNPIFTTTYAKGSTYGVLWEASEPTHIILHEDEIVFPNSLQQPEVAPFKYLYFIRSL